MSQLTLTNLDAATIPLTGRHLIEASAGTGKTYTAFQIIWRLWKSRQKKRILFLADRNILVDQSKNNDFLPFGSAMTKVTKRTVDMAHACGVSVEGELGCLGSLETGEAGDEDGSGAEGILTHDQLLTDPEEAASFVKDTHVDALAIAIGTSHGAYKFTRPPTGDILAIDRIKEIHKRIPDTHLVMHGSSAVPQDWLEIINKFGGDIPETYGVPVEEVQEGIKHGVRKVNIDTDLRLASTGAIRRFLDANKSEFDPRKYLSETLVAMKEICINRYESFGTAGNADKISPLSLEEMHLQYLSGNLDPTVN